MATLDTLLFTDALELRHEEVASLEEMVHSLGGKGLVSAVAMAAAGAAVDCFSLIGEGSEIPDHLKGLDSRHLIEVLPADNRVWITVSQGQQVVTLVKRSVPDAEAERGLRGEVAEFIARIDALYITLEHPPLLRAVLKEATGRGIPIALNPSAPLIDLLAQEDPRLFFELIEAATIILCNEKEAREAEGVLSGSFSDTGKAPSLEEIVITDGGRGGRFASAPFGEWGRYAAVPARELCVVGAGDTFNGGYLVRRWEGKGIAESARAGAELAAEKVSYRASTLPLEMVRSPA